MHTASINNGISTTHKSSWKWWIFTSAFYNLLHKHTHIHIQQQKSLDAYDFGKMKIVIFRWITIEEDKRHLENGRYNYTTSIEWPIVKSLGMMQNYILFVQSALDFPLYLCDVLGVYLSSVERERERENEMYLTKKANMTNKQLPKSEIQS